MNRILKRASAALVPGHPWGRALALSAALDAISTGVVMSSFVLYFVDVIEIPSAKVALASTAAGVLALFVPVPLGRIADRYGAGRFYVALLLVRAVAGCLYVLATSFATFAVVTVLFTMAHRASLPLQQSAVISVLGGHDQARTMAAIRAIRNIGLTVGSLLAAAAFVANQPFGFASLFLGSAILFAVAALVVRPVLATNEGPDGSQTADLKPQRQSRSTVRSPFRDRRFMALTAANGVLFLHDTLLSVMLPVWVLEHTDVPAAVVPLLDAVNTVLTVVLQVHVAKYAEGLTAARRLLMPSGFLLGVSCLVLALAAAVPTVWSVVGIVAAVVVVTVAENLHAVAAWELSAGLSPPQARTEYLSAFSLALAGQKAAGPALLVIVLMPLGPAGWVVLGTGFMTAALAARSTVDRSVVEGAPDSERLP